MACAKYPWVTTLIPALGASSSTAFVISSQSGELNLGGITFLIESTTLGGMCLGLRIDCIGMRGTDPLSSKTLDDLPSELPRIQFGNSWIQLFENEHGVPCISDH